MMPAIAVLKVRPFPMCRGIRRVVAIVISLPKRKDSLPKQTVLGVIQKYPEIDRHRSNLQSRFPHGRKLSQADFAVQSEDRIGAVP